MKLIRPINTNGKPANISDGFNKYHKGVDYSYANGTNIYAPGDGKIVIAKGNETRQWIANGVGDPFKIQGQVRQLNTADYGNFVRIDHGNGQSSILAHFLVNSLKVKVGDTVKKGQLIAQVGSTGNSTGNHLHWETRRNEVPYDPSSDFDGSFTAYQGTQTTPSMSEHDKLVLIGVLVNGGDNDSVFRSKVRELLK